MKLDIDAALRQLGYEEFRPGQREAVEALFTARRLLLVAPTGGGKSLTYQLPATLLPGTTLVISPLIALMNDQVSALAERQVASTYLASTLEGSELKRRMAAMAAGEFKLVYCAPERLAFPGFRSLLRDLDCPLIAVDEAHCISEWGHDFRPEYMQIGTVIDALPKARVLACTATATPVVRDEILERLGLDADTPQIVRGFARPNLALRVADTGSARDRRALVDAVLAETLGSPAADSGAAIVYSPTRKAAEAEAERLSAAGWLAEAYHAGLDARRRDRVQARFTDRTLQVVVATNAFGMGIDRADVRAVVHLAPPGSIEAYYQEVGRAGRDGRPAVGLLMVSAGDMGLRRRLIESDSGAGAPDPEVVKHKWAMFLELMRWSEGGSCRHDAILRYFDDEEETLAGCGRCDICVDLSSEAEDDPEQVTLIVRKALSGVARIHGRFGIQLAAKLLAGASDERLSRSGLDATKTFGALSDRDEEWLLRLLRRCVTAGWVDFDGGERPVIYLTETGRAVMVAERPVRLLLPPTRSRTPAAAAVGGRSRAAKGAATATPELELDGPARGLFEALRRHRLAVARQEGVPPYVVASDRTLRDIAAMRPRSDDDLLRAHGIGEAKLRKYGRGLLAVVAES